MLSERDKIAGRKSAPVAGFSRLDIACAITASLIHLALALLYTQFLGLSITTAPVRATWDWFWQNAPVDLLRTQLLATLAHLHAQPPLFNLWSGLLAKLFYPRHLQALHAANILLGTLLPGMFYLASVQLLRHRSLAFALSLFLALHPSLFLYEAYILYTLPSAFLVTAGAFCLSWHRATRSTIALHSFVITLNLLVLTRSIYQVVLLPPALALVFVLSAAHRRKRTLLVAAAICLFSVGWCAKNLVSFGSFATSSWSGMGLWRIAAADYYPDELRNLSSAGTLDSMVVEHAAFSNPSKYRPFGFDRSSSVPLLARDDLHNVNIPAISQVYGTNAVRLILHNPFRYGRSLYRSYLKFCRPSSQFKHLQTNAARMGYHEILYSQFFQGGLLMSMGDTNYGSFLLFLLPLSLVLYLRQLLILKDQKSLSSIAEDEATLLWCFAIITYTAAISCAFEWGEQDRFKFLVEPLVWIFIPAVLLRVSRGTKEPIVQNPPTSEP